MVQLARAFRFDACGLVPIWWCHLLRRERLQLTDEQERKLPAACQWGWRENTVANGFRRRSVHADLGHLQPDTRDAFPGLGVLHHLEKRLGSTTAAATTTTAATGPATAASATATAAAPTAATAASSRAAAATAAAATAAATTAAAWPASLLRLLSRPEPEPNG